MTMSVSEAFLRGLPKAELHVHLEGTMDPELKVLLAERNGVQIEESNADEVRAHYRFHDLSSFLKVYYQNMEVLRTANDFRDLSYRYLKRAAGEGVLHAEMFFDPQSHTSRGVPFGTVIGGYRRGIVEAEREFGISASLILCFLRDYGAPYAMSTLMEALPYRDWILGVGLDSDERDHPPVEYREVFARARAEGFLLTMHCDVDQKDTTEHIRQVIEEIGVDRIDHGTNILEAPALVDLVRARGIGLTCCPLSNSLVSDGLKDAEILRLLHEGVRVTINSDDPPYFDGYILGNFIAFAEATGASRDELVQLARNSFQISWLSDAARTEYLEKLDHWVEAQSALPDKS